MELATLTRPCCQATEFSPFVTLFGMFFVIRDTRNHPK